MAENNSTGGAKFGFGKANTAVAKEEVNTTSPVEEYDDSIADVPAVTGEVKSYEQEVKENANAEYTHISSVTISLVKNYSLYRKANDKVLPKKIDYIGGSVSASRTLSANKDEIEKYFPNLVGVAPNNPDFTTRVKQYLNNIRIPVDELGRVFNTSFHYYRKADYYHIKAEEERIEEVYQKANRSDLKSLREALQAKLVAINSLESSKHKHGFPINADDYLMYRHCLLYKDVAKDVSLINSDRSIRFYFKDDAKEAEKLAKYRNEVNKAKMNYVQCLADDTLFDAVYIQYCVNNNLPVIASLAENRLDREIKLDKYSADEPVKFNKIFANKDIKLMAVIERLIARGEFIRSDYNQNITSAEGEFIGANIGEAVAWFKNPDNTSAINALKGKLNNI